jgi:Zn-dependent M16 (insulinase) family peptidase
MTWIYGGSQGLDAVAATLHRYRHPCGLVHWHMDTDSPHCGFAIAFRTPPADGSGAPHILEHTVLCGSRRFPVRDPFFNMLRRSLQTFMNAMTYPDHTVYPFSTQVAKDFEHLLAVYLDCVFAPLLDPRDFAQEGHRLDPRPGGARRAGVVYNEMRGAFDDPDERIQSAVAAALFPDTCHRWNSGGDPAAIPDLDAAALRACHWRWYRPANALVVTCGDLEPVLIHRALEPYLDDPGEALPPPAVQAVRPPVELIVPVPPGEDPEDAASAALHWVWGDAADIDRLLDGELLERVLLGHPGAPLRRILESSGLGRSIGDSGLHVPHRHVLFEAGLSGIDPARVPEVRRLVLDGLVRIAEEGVSADEIAAALHQVELSRREIGGDSLPWPLELCLRAVPAWNHGVDPLPFIDQEPAIAALRRRSDPARLAALVRELIVCGHHCWAVAVPDAGLAEREEAAAAARDAADAARGDPAERAAAAAALAAHQARSEDPAVLPTLVRADIPLERPWGDGATLDGVWCAEPPANGMLHHLALWPVPPVADRDLDLLPLLAGLIGNVGVGSRGFAEESHRLNGACGGLWGWLEWGRSAAGALVPTIGAEVRGLASRGTALTSLLPDTAAGLRCDEEERIGELLDQALQRLQERVAGGGRLAAVAACRGFGGTAALLHRTAGLGRLAWLDRAAEDGVDHGRLAALATTVLGQRPRPALIGTGARELVPAVAGAWVGHPPSAVLAAPGPESVGPTAWVGRGQVNHLALAFPAPGFTDPDGASLAVACQILTHRWLHPRIREQGGAYGAGAHYDPALPAVLLTTYRDPRLAGSLSDMRSGLAWLARAEIAERDLDEGILAVVAAIDAPASPVGECRARFLAESRATTISDLAAWRSRVLRVDPDTIRHAVRRWLDPEGGVVAAIAAKGQVRKDGLGWAEIPV